MNKIVQNILRWIAVLPCAILAGFLATFILHFILYTTIGRIFTPYPEFPERALMPFIVVMTFIWTGFHVAPTQKLIIAIVLFSACILLSGGFIILTFTGGKWFGKVLYFEAGGMAPFLAIAGSFVGLYLTWRKDKQQKSYLKEKKEVIINDSTHRVSFLTKFGMDIFNLILVLILVFCLISHKGRIIIFSIFFILSLLEVYSKLKKKKYTSTKMKLNLIYFIIMAILLLIGILYQNISFYVSILFLALYTFNLIWYFITTHLLNKKSISKE